MVIEIIINACKHQKDVSIQRRKEIGAKTEYQKETKEWNVAERLQAEKDTTSSNFSDK